VVELCYEFTNTGDFPVAVEEFLHTCGCMIGTLEGKTVEPGATGKIRAKFLTAGLRGTVRKSLRVRFFEMGTVELVAEVTIPETLTYSARTLRWSIGDECVARDVDITVNSKKPVRVLSVNNGDPAFTATLATLEEGRRYRVTLTPRDTTSERVGVFQIRTDATDARDALQGLFALVEKGGIAAKPATKGGRP